MVTKVQYAGPDWSSRRWQIGLSNYGPKPYFVFRIGPKAGGIDRPQIVLTTKAGKYRRFVSPDAAQRAADKANLTVEA